MGEMNVTSLLTCAPLSARTADGLGCWLNSSSVAQRSAPRSIRVRACSRNDAPKRSQGCQIPRPLTGSFRTKVREATKCVAVWGKAGVSQRRTIREFVVVEAMPAYSKRTREHGGIARDIIQADELWSSTRGRRSQVARQSHTRLVFSAL
jgi:hypothetical protein